MADTNEETRAQAEVNPQDSMQDDIARNIENIDEQDRKGERERNVEGSYSNKEDSPAQDEHA